MGDAGGDKVWKLVTDMLTELGKPDVDLSCVNRTVLIRDGYYVGHSMQYEDIRIVLHSGGECIEFFGEDGALLKTITLVQSSDGEREAA